MQLEIQAPALKEIQKDFDRKTQEKIKKDKSKIKHRKNR